MQCVLLLSHCLILIGFKSFAVCYVLIIYFIHFLIIGFMFVFFLFYVLLSILCVLFSCTVLCTLSAHVQSRLFSVGVQFYRPLPPGGNSFAVNKYRRRCHRHHHHHIIQHFTFVIQNRKFVELRASVDMCCK